MKALIYKDFVSIKKSLILMGLIIGAMCLYFYNEGQILLTPTFFILIPIILLGMVFGTDSQDNVNKYLIAMGFDRKKIVVSRCFIVWIMVVFALILTSFLGFSENPLTKNISMALILSLVFFLTSIMSLIQLPLMYKFGAEKSRLIFVLMYFAVFAFFSAVSSNREIFLKYLDKGLSMDQNLLAFLIFVCGILANIISLYLSVRVYENKEF